MTSDSEGEFEPSPHSFVSQGLTLNYVDWGNAGAPLLLFVHGNRDHARSWDGVARELRRDWHVLALDLRGHGDSEWSPDAGYLSSYQLLDILALFEAIGGQPAAVVGHSFGGNIAARFTAAFPQYVSKLVLVDGFGPLPEHFAQWVEVGPVQRTRQWIEQRRTATARPPKTFATVAEAAGRLKAGNARLSDALSHELALHGLKRVGDGFQWKWDPLVSAFPPEEFSADSAAVWREINCPTLLCWGVESWNRNPESDGRASNLRDYRTAPIEAAGHWPHHDQFEAFVSVLRGFLEPSSP